MCSEAIHLCVVDNDPSLQKNKAGIQASKWGMTGKQAEDLISLNIVFLQKAPSLPYLSASDL